MNMNKGKPPKETGKEYIIEMSNHPAAVGSWNAVEESFHIASLQLGMYGGELIDSYYENQFIDEKDITGWIEI